MAWKRIGSHKYTTNEEINKYLASLSNDDYLKSKIINLDKLELQNASIGTKNPFKKWNPSHKEQYTRPVTVFDTETGSNNEILSVGAIKLAFNKVKRAFEYVDTYERFYYSKDTKSQSYRQAIAVNGLTQGIIGKLRRQQGLHYGKYYDAQEQIKLREFIGDSILSGHNIENADIPWAFGNNISNNTIDTLIAMENMRGRGGNKLDEVFKDIFGKSMEEAGFSHHGAMSDTMATALILNYLAQEKDVTGASIRYVLNHKGTSIAPLDNPDIYGSSGVVTGPFKGYMRDPNYYISRRNLFMTSEFKDPETGGLIAGMHWDDESSEWDAYKDLKSSGGGQRIAHTESMDKWMSTFNSMVSSIKSSVGIMTQTLTDLKGFSALDSASARPGQISFLSKFATSEPLSHNQRFIDAAAALHIPSTDMENYYRTAYDYALATGKGQNSLEEERNLGGWRNDLLDFNKSDEKFHDDWINKRFEDAKKAQKALRHHNISQSRYDSFIYSAEDIDDALDEATQKTKEWTGALRAFEKIKVFDPNRLFQAYGEGLSHSLSAARGIIPPGLYDPISRAVDISKSNNLLHFRGFNAADNIMNAVGPAAAGAAFAINPIAGAVVAGGLGVAKLGTQLWGNVKEARIQKYFDQMSIGLNTAGIGIDLLLLPFKALSRVTKLLTVSFKGLLGAISGGITSMGSLGNPLTTLTGVDYAKYQGLEVAESMLGLSKGTLNSTVEDYARQRELLYSTGQMDKNRVIASSILGVFDDVYGSGNYESMINKLASRELSARDMALVSQLDPHSAQVLEVMKSLGATSLSQLANPTALRDVYFNPINNRERRNFRQDYYELSSMSGSINNSFMRISDRLWRAGGKAIGEGFNRFIAGLAEGNVNIGDLKGSIKNAWSNFKESDIGQGIKEVWDTIKSELSSLWEGKLFPKLLDIVAKIADTWLVLLDKAVDVFAPLVDKFMNTIMNIRIDGNPMTGYEVKMNRHGRGGYQVGMVDENGKTVYGNNSYYTKAGFQSMIDQAKASNGRITVNEKGVAEELSPEQAQAWLDSGYGSWEDYGGSFAKTAHSFIGSTRRSVQKAKEELPNLIDTITDTVQGAIESVATEVTTTVKLIIEKDGKTSSQVFDTDKGSMRSGNILATVSSTSQRSK